MRRRVAQDVQPLGIRFANEGKGGVGIQQVAEVDEPIPDLGRDDVGGLRCVGSNGGRRYGAWVRTHGTIGETETNHDEWERGIAQTTQKREATAVAPPRQPRYRDCRRSYNGSRTVAWGRRAEAMNAGEGIYSIRRV
ncbi:hypothetical protein Cenrod_0121 [Candidatus Symbiobacter mobilis CR]|uniref:Uncharacterized protein n=1 Tax=Candidatus Symbiobacter mobilis CR TaxID=946483 RepID=U5N4Q9_9BURK|nr:hypothetical protein Cenrod_0121 [Candidatus Symbiobacter mobilis CR]